MYELIRKIREKIRAAAQELEKAYFKYKHHEAISEAGILSLCRECKQAPRLYHKGFRDNSRVWYYQCDCGIRGAFAMTPVEAVYEWNLKDQIPEMEKFP